jgi:adenylate cyclase class 2
MEEPSMNWEVEQKFRLSDPREMEARLAALGAHFQSPIEQVDHYFRHPARDFAKTDEALRLRQVGIENLITYKGPKIDPATKTRRELELPLPSGNQSLEQFAELLAALGFTPVAKVKKLRQLASLNWEGFAVECALDEVELAGSFLELEISANDQSLKAATISLANLANRLNLGPSERRSYLELVLNSVS